MFRINDMKEEEVPEVRIKEYIKQLSSLFDFKDYTQKSTDLTSVADYMVMLHQRCRGFQHQGQSYWGF